MKTTTLVPFGQGNPSNIISLLPMPPWQGPPLPRFLNIRWPWLQSGGSFLPSLPHPFVSNVGEGEHSTALTTSDNLEEIDFPEGFDPDTFMPKKIRIKRHKEIK